MSFRSHVNRFFWSAARFVLITLAAAFLTVSMQAQSPAFDSSAASVEGLWGAETRLGIPVQGQLTIDSRGGKWEASISGYTVPATLNGKRLTLSLPGKLGAFQGHYDAQTQGLRGEWIQSAGIVLDGQYASLVTFRLSSPHVWQGNVVPLEQRISAYLSISRRDGRLTAVASNPEGNFFDRRVYSVTQEGNSISIEANGKKFSGVYDQQAGTLSLPLVDWLPAFQFTRRSATDAAGYYPRVPANGEPWTYRAPAMREDGWSVSTLKREGMDEAALAKLLNRILEADPNSTSLKVQSLLIARHGRLVLEDYFYGFSADRVHDMRSAGKTFAPVLVGLAQQQGSTLGPRTPVYPLFSQYGAFANPDERKQHMTLQNIMTMTAGNACDDNDDESPGNEDRMQSNRTQPDWYKYTLDLPMIAQPGDQQAVYCSGDLNLVGGAVAADRHTWLPDFFEEHLARPLQFSRYYLNLMPTCEAYMGGGAYLTPRDQLKLGQLYLDGGVWHGKRLVSKAWVADSTSFHARFAKERSLGQEHEYGYGWHLHTLQSDGRAYKVFAAEGNGGQFVIVIPALDLVIGMTGGAYGEFAQWYRWELELVPTYLIPAVAAR